MRVIVATNNAGKMVELRALLGDAFDLLTLQDAALDSPEETGHTFEENALLKARAASTHADAAIADDSGLEVSALAGAPGVMSARYGGEHATDDQNNAKLLAALIGVPQTDRTARFVSSVTFVTASGTEFVARGEIEGTITEAPRGTGGFGYDPLFEIADPGAGPYTGRTMAELSSDEKNGLSHRARAFRDLQRQLDRAGLLTPDRVRFDPDRRTCGSHDE